ncbi:MAG: 6-carboxytetrahydropterin synthase [PVC group bacterium]
MYEVFIQVRFSAAHFLAGHPGPCRNLHGHNWLVRVSLRCRELDGLGMGYDFTVLKEELSGICRGLDHAVLNELDYFRDRNPTAENVARFIHASLSERINDGRVEVSEVEVRETSDSGASYYRQM